MIDADIEDCESLLEMSLLWGLTLLKVVVDSMVSKFDSRTDAADPFPHAHSTSVTSRIGNDLG
jgi:hypothetical protein